MTGAVGEEDLAALRFTARDAVLLTDQTQFLYLAEKANSSFRQCRIFPLSTQAYGAALLGGHEGIEPYFEFLDFADIQRRYRFDAEEQAKGWLAELGLRCEVKGIDLAALDAPNQFLLFRLAWYLESTARRMIEAHPEIETFYVLCGETPLPLDFYFDSDVPAVLLRFICERLRRRVRPIVMKERDFLFAAYRERPMRSARRCAATEPEARTRTGKARRAGFLPVTVTRCQQILDALHALDYETVLFDSAWGMPTLFRDRTDTERDLSDRPGADTSRWETKLAELWREIRERWTRSKVPESIKANPHAQFQMEYIVRRRWLAYANMIDRAAQYVANTPLDVFVHADTFTAEGAILANLYRRSGARIVVAPHTQWPCDAHWSARERTDAGLVSYRGAGKRLRENSGMQAFVIGGYQAPTYQSVLHRPIAIPAKEREADDRKTVVFVTNVLELLAVPTVNLQTHFRTLAVLARVPGRLAKRVRLAIRSKPRPLGEHLLLYQKLCGFSEESVRFLEGLSFSASVRTMDCAVGVNIPTTGYYEIMESGVPLLHVQTTEAVTLQPDLPAEVTGEVTSDDEIWTAIEGVLFDQKRRGQLLERQQRFLADEREPTFRSAEEPVTAVLRHLTERRIPLWERWWRKTPRTQEEGQLRVSEGGAGQVDEVLAGSNGTLAVSGWAADRVRHQPASAVYVLVDGKRVASAPVSYARPDVAAALGDARLEYAGFTVRVRGEYAGLRGRMKVYAELGDGSLYALTIPDGP